jgi:hypothetical protein
MSGGSHLGSTPGPEPVHTLVLIEVTSVLVYSSQRVRSLTANLETLEAFYRKVRSHNLLAGWWAVPLGLIYNPIALNGNRKAMRAVRDRGASNTASPGWYPDPTGRHGVRYWDGRIWTDEVSDITTDPVTVTE